MRNIVLTSFVLLCLISCKNSTSSKEPTKGDSGGLYKATLSTDYLLEGLDESPSYILGEDLSDGLRISLYRENCNNLVDQVNAKTHFGNDSFYKLTDESGGLSLGDNSYFISYVDKSAGQVVECAPLVKYHYIKGGITKVVSIGDGFVAIMESGRLISWGGDYNKNYMTSAVNKDLVGVVDIMANNGAVAALKTDGTVVTWGSSGSGGDSSSVQSQLVNVDTIYASQSAFAALKTDGTVVAWGNSYYGGDSSLVQSQLVNVDEIYSTEGAFAALKTNGTVVTWGSSSYGGDSSSVQSQLVNVDEIYSTERAFAALKTNG
ncbi:MAG: hypothetical protein ACRBBP_02975, partial [Bdellovibrionales bacterium]